MTETPAPRPVARPSDPAIAATLAEALALPPLRVRRILAADGQVYWLKRLESHAGWHRRLQKGDPAAALRADRDGLVAMERLGLPAPRLLAQGPDYLLLTDSGPAVPALILDPRTSPEAAASIIADCARTLARLHAAGVSHGRPKLRDICHTPQQGAVLIDFEQFREGHEQALIGRDVALFLHSILEVRGARDALFDAGVSAYRRAAPEAFWQAGLRAMRRAVRAAPLARLALMLGKARRESQALLDLRTALRSMG